MIPLLGLWVKMPNWVKHLLGIVALSSTVFLSLLLWLHFHDKRVVKEHDLEVYHKVDAVATGAATTAAHVQFESKSKVEKTNERARQAADASDDPLADGLRQLHNDRGQAKAPTP